MGVGAHARDASAAAALLLAFVALELRSPSPLLPLRIFRLRMLTAANATMTIIGAVTFSEFFLLTLYLQDVLHYSAIKTGAAFAGFALTVIVVSNVAQLVVGRFGVRPTLTLGLLVSTLSIALLTRLPVDGHYFWDLFPAFVLGGAGLGLSFVPITIAGLAGVERSRAGVASGLINTSRQIGGAVGLAAASTIAITSADQFASAHPALNVSSSVALDHGLQTALYALLGLLILGVVIAATLLKPAPKPQALPQPADAETIELSELPESQRPTQEEGPARVFFRGGGWAAVPAASSRPYVPFLGN